MRRLILPLLLLLAHQFLLFPQEGAGTPPEPEVELPELSLSFDEDLNQVLPLVDLDLDEALELAPLESLEPNSLDELRPAGLDLAVPEFEALPYGSDSAPLYGRGYVGFGNANYLRGEVEIATLGANPAFGLSYAHRSLDGFGTHAPGEGYSFRREAVRGEASWDGEAGRLAFTGAFSEEERGLQGQSIFTAALERRYALDLSWDRYPERGWYRSLFLGGEGAYQNLAATDPEDTTHLTLRPALEVGYDWGSVALGVAGEYRLRTAFDDSSLHLGRVQLTGESDLGPTAGVSGRIGAAWSDTQGFRFPGELRLNAGLSENLSLELFGGYFFRGAEYGPLLEENPFLRLPAQPLETEEGIEAEFLLRYRLGEGLYLTAGSGYLAGTIYSAADQSEAASPLLPVVESRAREVQPEARLDFPVGKRLFGSFSGRLRYDYEEAATEAFVIEGSLERDDLDAELGFSVAAEWLNPEESDPPRLDGEAWWAPSQGIRLILDLQDILIPFDEGGRIDASGLELPGMVVSLAAEIRL